MKNIELLGLHEQLNSLADMALPTAISFAVTKNILDLEALLKPYFEERGKLIKSFAELDDKGEVKSDNNGNIIFRDAEGFSEEFAKLNDIDVDFSPHPLKEKDILEGDVPLSPRQMASLLRLVKE